MFGNDSHVCIYHDAVALPHMFDGVPEHLHRVPALVRRIGIREKCPDVLVASRRAQECVGQRMRYGIAIRVTSEVNRTRHFDTTKEHPAAGGETMRIVPDSGAKFGVPDSGILMRRVCVGHCFSPCSA
jgi:hypothetical protein